jgi:hypothetical protein
MKDQSLEVISEIIGEYLNPIYNETRIVDSPEEEVIYNQYVEPFLITLNSDDATLFALDENEVALNLFQIIKEIAQSIDGLYNIEGAITSSTTFAFAPCIASVSKYDTLILKVIYESQERICPGRIIDSFTSKAPKDLKSKKKHLLNKLFRSYNQVLSSDGFVHELMKRFGKHIPNHKSLIRSIIPLSFLDQSAYFNGTPKFQTPYQPHFYKC